MTFGSDLFEAMSPLARDDAERGSPLATYCAAIGAPFEWVVTYALDRGGAPGWSLLMSPATCPAEGLAWLAQFVGVTLAPMSSEAQQRAQIAAHVGFNRGRPASIVGTVQATLSGGRHVFLTERAGGDAYALDVITYVSETPDPAATEAAVRAATPAGIVVTYSTEVWDYAVVHALQATYAALLAAEPTYDDLMAGGT